MVLCSMLWLQNPMPVAFSIGTIDIRWYSIAYVLAILSAAHWTRYCVRKNNITLKKKLFIDPFLTQICLGVIIGGRLGHILLFEPMEYLRNPLSIFAIWEGGMSFHGGFLGVVFQMWRMAKNNPPLTWQFLLARAAYISPIGIFFGRVANYLNCELVGRPTNGSWGVVFWTHDTIPRHPSQLYEAFLEGPILWLWVFLVGKRKNNSDWDTCIHFVLGYSTVRFISEYFREPNGTFGPFSLGQIYCIITFIGCTLLFHTQRKRAN